MSEEEETKMVEPRSWDNFRESGMLFFINTLLHFVGWSIVVELEEGKVVKAYPARVKFRGFDDESQTKGHRMVARWLAIHGATLLREAKDEEA